MGSIKDRLILEKDLVTLVNKEGFLNRLNWAIRRTLSKGNEVYFNIMGDLKDYHFSKEMFEGDKYGISDKNKRRIIYPSRDSEQIANEGHELISCHTHILRGRYSCFPSTADLRQLNFDRRENLERWIFREGLNKGVNVESYIDNEDYYESGSKEDFEIGPRPISMILEIRELDLSRIKEFNLVAFCESSLKPLSEESDFPTFSKKIAKHGENYIKLGKNERPIHISGPNSEDLSTPYNIIWGSYSPKQNLIKFSGRSFWRV